MLLHSHHNALSGPLACATEPETTSVCCCFSLFSCQGAWSVTNLVVTHLCIAASFARHPLRLSQTVWYCQEGNSCDNPEGSDHSLEVFVSLGSGRFLMLKRLVEDIRHSYMTTGSEVLLESKTSHACACSDALFGAAKMSMPQPQRDVNGFCPRFSVSGGFSPEGTVSGGVLSISRAGFLLPPARAQPARAPGED